MCLGVLVPIVALLVAALGSVPPSPRVSFALSPQVIEYSTEFPINLPPCHSGLWSIAGGTYDGVCTCTSSSQIRISINAFRCQAYSTTPNYGIVGCTRCFYGWSYDKLDPKRILPWTSEAQARAARIPVLAYFVPQIVQSPIYMQSCLMVYDMTLASRCDYITRYTTGPQGSYATCTKGRTTTPFRDNLRDAFYCLRYGLDIRGQLICVG